MRVWATFLLAISVCACGSSSGNSGNSGNSGGGASVVGVNMAPGHACTETTGTHCYEGKVVSCTLGAWSMVENCAPAACVEKFTGSGACATGVTSDATSSGDASDAK